LSEVFWLKILTVCNFLDDLSENMCFIIQHSLVLAYFLITSVFKAKKNKHILISDFIIVRYVVILQAGNAYRDRVLEDYSIRGIVAILWCDTRTLSYRTIQRYGDDLWKIASLRLLITSIPVVAVS
jgi:hypothetical protein